MAVETADKSKPIVARALSSIGELATLPEVTVKIREMCECLTGSVWGLEDIVDLTDSEESLARGLQKLQSIGGQHGKENHYSC